jgi:hypothetical protein
VGVVVQTHSMTLLIPKLYDMLIGVSYVQKKKECTEAKETTKGCKPNRKGWNVGNEPLIDASYL